MSAPRQMTEPTVLAIRLDRSMRDDLEAAAEDRQVSMAWLARCIIGEWLSPAPTPREENG